MKKLLYVALSLFAVAVLAAEVENCFPDGSLDKTSERVSGYLGGKPLEGIAVFEKTGGVDNSGCVKVTIDPSLLKESNSHRDTGLVIRPNGELHKVIVTFYAKWGNSDGGTITVARFFGGSDAKKVSLTGEWQKQEVEISSVHPIELIFSTLFEANMKGGTFYLDNINVKDAE